MLRCFHQITDFGFTQSLNVLSTTWPPYSSWASAVRVRVRLYVCLFISMRSVACVFQLA